jgi:dTDP-4-dehydrorhamnose reductase
VRRLAMSASDDSLAADTGQEGRLMAGAEAEGAAGRVLVTGCTGQVGGELVKSLARLWGVIAPKREEFDLSDTAGDFSALRQKIRSVHPRWIVNAAAYTAVDKAEAEPELAYAINRDALKAIGEEAQKVGAAVIHFSTDYVFDGTGERPYSETDSTGPLGVYGASKLAGERALDASGCAHIIFRTSWVYGATGKNFLLTMLKLAREREELRVVDDQHGSPTWSRDLAEMTAQVIRHCEREASGVSFPETVRSLGGVYHAAGTGFTTWRGFAAEAIRLQKEDAPAVKWAEVKAVSTAEYPTAARRPANSRLNCDKLKKRFGWEMMAWRESLRKVILEL